MDIKTRETSHSSRPKNLLLFRLPYLTPDFHHHTYSSSKVTAVSQSLPSVFQKDSEASSASLLPLTSPAPPQLVRTDMLGARKEKHTHTHTHTSSLCLFLSLYLSLASLSLSLSLFICIYIYIYIHIIIDIYICMYVQREREREREIEREP